MAVDNSGSFGCFGTIVALIVGAFLSLFVAGSSQTFVPVPADPSIVEGQGGGGETFQSLTVVERVDLIVDAAYIDVTVSGYQPDGCEFPVIVEQSRSGNQISIKIYRDVPLAVLCAQMLVPYMDTIRVEGPFEPGTYTIDVNGSIVEVAV